MSHLFLFQLGPVQSFIAAGRRTEDLYVGSRMLSELAKSGLSAARTSTGFMPIFPMIDENQPLPQGVPHRFAFISNDDPSRIANDIEQAVKDRWRDEFAFKVYQYLSGFLGEGDWQQTFEDQMEGWIEFYWVAVPYNERDHGGSLRRANAALAQRKLLRHFPQVEEPGRKCTLTGSQSALRLDWAQLKKRIGDKRDILFRTNEYLGTIALTKRLARLSECELGISRQKIRSTRFIAGLTDDEEDELDEPGRRQEGYLAVLHMDGDRMGIRLSQFTQLNEHQAFSEKLANFADSIVPSTINKYGGATAQFIYAGGDDVLALLPLSDALRCAYELRKAFGNLTGCTASAGIAITPYDFPLDAALDIAREAEAMAKEEYGRDAIVVTEAHSSGTIRHAGGSWEVVELVEKLYQYFKEGQLSGKLGYDLLEVANYMSGRVPTDARKAEITRLLRRRTADGVDDDKKHTIEALANDLMRFGDIDDADNDTLTLNWESVAHWVILARFLAQPTLEEVV